jgi:hypothetical protein
MDLYSELIKRSNMLTQNKLNDLQVAGKLDSAHTAQMEFSQLSKSHASLRSSYLIAKDQYATAKENLNQFNNSSLANKIVHPVKSFRLHRQLARDVKKSKETLDKTKAAYKAVQKELREFKRATRAQHKAMIKFEKTKQMIQELNNPSNQKYVTMLPAQRQQMAAWFMRFQSHYDSLSFGVNQQNGNKSFETLVEPPEKAFTEISQAYNRMVVSRTKDRARQTIDRARHAVRDTLDKMAPKPREEAEESR